MKLAKCPGSLGFSQPRPADIRCPNCGEDVEIWSDEATGRCSSCGRTVIRTDTQSCIDWCRYAEECLGEDGYREYGEMKAAIRKAALWQAVVDRLGETHPAVVFCHTVLRFGEQLCSQESGDGADPMVVVAAAMLLYLGVGGRCLPGADDAAGAVPDVGAVTAMLGELNFDPDAIAKVNAIHASLLSAESMAPVVALREYAVVHDAVLLATFEQLHTAGEEVSPEGLPGQCITEEAALVAIEMRRAAVRRAPTEKDQHE